MWVEPKMGVVWRVNLRGPGVSRIFLSQFYPDSPRCWERNDVKAIWWIIRTPILITILVWPVPHLAGCAQGFPVLGCGAPPPAPSPEWGGVWLSLFLLAD
jgi:hypothetical protein